MSKKYDNNLQEIKETRTIATNTTIDSKDLGTLGAYFEREMAYKKIEELQQQIAEKDEEIDILKHSISDWKTKSGTKEHSFDISTDEMRFDIVSGMVERIKKLRNQLKDQLHQICEEIREWCKENYCSIEDYAKQSSDGYYPADKFDKKLDKIEKGEEL